MARCRTCLLRKEARVILPMADSASGSPGAPISASRGGSSATFDLPGSCEPIGTRRSQGMDLPSRARLMVELQKAVTRGHRLLLQSPLGPLLAATPVGRFLVLHTIGRRSGQARQTPLS